MAEEHLFLIVTVTDAAEPVAHAPLHHHGPCQARSLLNIPGSAGSDVLWTKDQEFRLAPTEDRGEICETPLLRMAQLVSFGQTHRHAERPATRNDRDLVQRIVAWNAHANEGMSCLVIGREALFIFRHGHGPALGAHHDL